jgi:hypothetical protein
MMNEDQTYQLIENYLNGQLSGEELNAFEKELSQNPALKKKVRAHKLANEMVIELRLQNIQSILSEEKLNYGRKTLWKKIISGISGGLVIASLLFFFNDYNKSEIQEPIASQGSQKTTSKDGVASDQKEYQTKPIPTDKPLTSANKPLTDNTNNLSYDSVNSINNHKISETQVSHNPVEAPAKEIIHPKETNETSKPCEHVDINSQISVSPTCEGESTGSITLSGFKGGTAPYDYIVLMKHHEHSNSNLAAGIYSVIIKDSKGCTKNMDGIEIVEKHCQKDYSFNPALGETWEIPTYKHSGTLILYDNGGNVYFTEEIGAGEKIQWSGLSKNGESKTGYFLFVINYKDGTNKHGSVTIVR